MAKKYSIEWYDTVTEWVHDAHKKNALSKTELMKEIRVIISTCENPIIAIKVWRVSSNSGASTTYDD